MRNLHQDAGAVAGARIVETLGRRPPAMLARGLRLFRGRGRRQYIRHDVFALELRPAHLSPLNKAKGLTVIGAPWAFAAPTGPPLVLREPQFQNSGLGVQRPRGTALPLYFRAPGHPTFVAIPVPGLPHN